MYKYFFAFRKARQFVQKYGFDGLDLDYEFPDASDKVNFAEWVKDIKAEFQQYNYEVINLNSPQNCEYLGLGTFSSSTTNLYQYF